MAADTKHAVLSDGGLGTYRGNDLWSTTTASDLRSGVSVLNDGVTIAGALAGSTNPGVGNVRLNTAYNIEGTDYTGTLAVPTAVSGTAGTVNIGQIKEQIRYILDAANTTGSSSVDLSGNLDKRVVNIMTLNPEKLRPQPSQFPLVTVFCEKKQMEQKSIGATQVAGKRLAKVYISIVGMIWQDTVADFKADEADGEIEKLMENVELILRYYADLNRVAAWQLPTAVTYHSMAYSEEAHMRVGIMELVVSVFY